MVNNKMIYVTKTELPPLSLYEKYLKKIWATSWVTNDGEFLKTLEKRLEKYLGVNNLLLITNGTLALQLAIKALNLSGEIITTPFTFAATTNAIIWQGCQPVFADCDLATYNIDPDDVEKKITPRTTAIMPVHVYGNPCQVEKLQKIAQRYKLKLIYDAAHAFAVEYNNRSVLKYGDISILSFHATKIFSTIEGGAAIVKDRSVYQKLRLLRNFGIINEEEVINAGINAKMSEFHAVMGLCNLKFITRRIYKCKKIYQRYVNGLSSNVNIQLQKLTLAKYNYGYMPVCFPTKKIRNLIFARLVENNFKPRKYFYPLMSDFDYIKKICGKNTTRNQFKNAANIADRILCLPIYPSLKVTIIDKIINVINDTLKTFN